MKKSLLYICIFLLTFSSCMKDLYIENEKTDNNDSKLPDLSVPQTFNWNEVYIKIPLPKNTNPDNIQISIPNLKYNKSFAYSYTFDDDIAQAYGKAFCTINKKWVDKERFFHIGQQMTTGETPTKSLGYTDGCGNEKRFAFGVAIWPNMSNTQITNFMNPSNNKIDKNYPYLVWKDIVPLIDFGCDIYFHNVSPIYNCDSISDILKGFQLDNETTKVNIGRKMKILARPDGNDNYIKAGNQYEDIVFMTAENNTAIGNAINISFNEPVNLKKTIQYRRYTEPISSVELIMPEIDKKVQSNTYAWIHDFSHGPADFQYILNLFTTLNNLYGKDGNDCIWFASLDEIYEYNNIRNNCIIQDNINNDTLTLKFALNSPHLPNELQYHRDFSIIIKGVQMKEETIINSGKNIYGLSYSQIAQQTLLINLDCNESLLKKAQRYTSLAESAQTDSSREDALYFINQLKNELREPLLQRIKKIQSSPNK